VKVKEFIEYLSKLPQEKEFTISVDTSDDRLPNTEGERAFSNDFHEDHVCSGDEIVLLFSGHLNNR